MANKLFSFFTALIFILITLAACQIPLGNPPIEIETPEAGMQTVDGTPLGANNNCPDRAAFGYLEEDVPVNGINVDTPILFRWEYYPTTIPVSDWSAECVPTSFTLYLSPGPDYSQVLTYPVSSPTVSARNNNLLISTSFTGSLEPHTNYRWIVIGHADGINIDEEQIALFTDSDAWKVTNNQSILMGQFQTGPFCDSTNIQPVSLLNPADEATLDTDAPLFQWDMPDCNSSAYWLSFSETSAFSNLYKEWVTNQSEFFMHENVLQPCTPYYWRVHAGLYSTSYHLSQGDWSTVSDSRSFIIRSANCPNASISSNPPLISSEGIPMGFNVDCPDRAAFGFLVEDVPVRGVNVQSPIFFRWEYYPNTFPVTDWSVECVPTSFTLFLSPGPDYTQVLSNPISSPIISASSPNNLLFSTVFSEPLEPHTSYRWIVVGHANQIDIDQDQLTLFSDPNAWKVTNNQSILSGQFQTGPFCNSTTIQPVSLINPPDETTLDTDTPFFQWDMPNCNAAAYWLTFSEDPDFNSIFRGLITNQSELMMNDGVLESCVQYYWRVHAGLYPPSYHISQGNWSSVSDISTFIIRSASCPNAIANWLVTLPTSTLAPPTSQPPTTQPPTPEPTEVVCENITDQATCVSASQCYWYKPLTINAPGECRTK